MNLERILNMIIRQIMRRLVNKGIGAGINAVSKSKNTDDIGAHSQPQVADDQQAKLMAKKARKAARLGRRI